MFVEDVNLCLSTMCIDKIRKGNVNNVDTGLERDLKSYSCIVNRDYYISILFFDFSCLCMSMSVPIDEQPLCIRIYT